MKLPSSIEVAREAIAAKKRQEDAHHTADLVLSGAWDDSSEVANALLGAMLMHSKCYARVKQLEEALRQARDFIADEYRDPSRELVGDWIAKEARPVFDNICTALGDANAPR